MQNSVEGKSVNHKAIMRLALQEARKAMKAGEVPVGAVIAIGNEIISKAHNLKETTNDPTAHAEVICIREASKRLGSSVLKDATLYVTLEPCPICAGAMIMARLKECYYGALDKRQGCGESVYALTQDPAFYHRLPCIGGLLEEECSEMLSAFFKEKRKNLYSRKEEQHMDKPMLSHIKTIVTDMDDTLFDENGKISEYTLEVMNECKKRGIQVIPSSGRAMASMKPHLEILNTGLPYIACNGAQLVNADHTIYSVLNLPVNVTQMLCQYFKENSIYVQAYDDKYFYFSNECEIAESYKQSSSMQGYAVGSLKEYLTFPVPKLLAVSSPERVRECYEEMREKFAGLATFTISKPEFLEAVPIGASKGEGLIRLAELIGINLDNTLCFGDSYNDISMLQAVTHSVAMGNACEDAKQIAKYICKPNTEDGLAQFVLEHVLGE